MFFYFKNSPGFSLVELLVTLAIISVMGVATLVGFGFFGHALKAKAISGLVNDTVKQAELEVLKGDYNKIILHLLPDYLLLEKSIQGQNLPLSWLPDGCFQIPAGGTAGILNQTDENGHVLLAEEMKPEKPAFCFPFENSRATQWQYQLKADGQFSSVFHLIHFNRNRDELANLFSLDVGTDAYQIIVDSPYAAKTFIKNGAILPAGIIDLPIKNGAEFSGASILLQ